MSSLASYILFALALALAGWTFMAWRGFIWNWLPPKLAVGRVAQMGHNPFINASLLVVDRPNQVYRLPDRLHAPLENRDRDTHRVYETDITQLSLQARLLRLSGLETAPFGFAAINNRETHERRAMRVELHDDTYCEQLVAWYIDLVEHGVRARKSRGRKYDTCGHRSKCFPLNP